MQNDPLTEKIIACCYTVHNELGPGFKETVYHNALKLAFEQEKLKYETEKQFQVCYKGKKVGKLIVDSRDDAFTHICVILTDNSTSLESDPIPAEQRIELSE